MGDDDRTALSRPAAMTTAFGGSAPITRSELKMLMRRSNKPAILWGAAWISVLATTTMVVWVSLGSWWQIPAMVLHGFVLVHHFSLQHEATHYTVFSSRRANTLVSSYCGFVGGVQQLWFRYEHCDHHTFTQNSRRDPELIDVPGSLPQYFRLISDVDYWRLLGFGLVRRALGRLNESETSFIPRSEHARVVRGARLMIAGYLTVAALMVLFDSLAPVWFWWLPLLLGQPFMRAIRMTEHVGRPKSSDASTNTRTCLIAAPLRLLCWNMNYHAEHHLAPSVPFHALPKLHTRVRGHLYIESKGYIAAHRAILRAVQKNTSCPAEGINNQVSQPR